MIFIAEKNSINKNAPVTAHIYGNTVEMSTVLGGVPTMRKLNKNQMLNTKTGEIINIHHVTSRADPKNYESLRRTFKRLKRLIGANFNGGNSELWLTLTYRDSPMTDSKRLYADFLKFIKKLRKIVGRYLAYIVVIEPQASGSLHAHLLLKTLDHSRLFIKNAIVAKAWGQGFVNVRRLSDSDNVASYLMAYLSDIDLNNLEGNQRKKQATKKIIKGGRLGLYPIGMQIYRRSRKGIVNPIKIKGIKQEITKEYNINGVEPDFYHKFEIGRVNKSKFKIETEFYNRKSQF